MSESKIRLSRGVAKSITGLVANAAMVFLLVAPLACGDDSSGETTNPALPGSADGGQSDAGGGTGADAGGSAALTSAASSAEIIDSGLGNGSASNTNESSVSSADAGPAPVESCRATRCTCPDPSAEDCCVEHLPYRREAVITPEEQALLDDGSADETEQPIATTYQRSRRELWSSFSTQCGTAPCHGLPAKEFTFFVTEDSFDDGLFDAEQALRLIRGDEAPTMPVGYTLEQAKERECTNPFVKLGSELVAWQKAGFADNFEVDLCPEEIEEPIPNPGPDPSAACGVSPIPFAVSPEVAQGQTNIGQCIPSGTIAGCPEEVLQAKDALFANTARSEDLPEKLSQTDLVSLDSEVLAMNRVFSYAPTYTLFSDNAKKQRYVRVPVGEKLVYDDETQDFDIPENTRFYKTFLREVIQEDGSVAYRKMETRLIVVRRDKDLGDGKFAFQALRATYAWTNDEREAHRVVDPKSNGEEWVDRVCPVIINKTLTRDPQANPIMDVVPNGCDYMTDAELEDPHSGRVRHYGIPGEDRCDQCHMGSNNHSYILGFNPWQVDRRKQDEGGVYDPVHVDELDQLARLISYGLIEGIEPGQARLETSQGERAPRNDHELKAQGYMLGNCAYCHSPHGFPSVENPLLKPLDMYPTRDRGGVFQFPLDMTSPRIAGGMPYITSDLRTGVDGASHPLYRTFDGVLDVVPDYQHGPDFAHGAGMFAYGPWMSAIWRNVYTPFTYTDEDAIFVHMPRHVPGFDCRAHNIMADWMLGVPSSVTERVGFVREVTPDHESYWQAKAQAELRVQNYHNSLTGQHCPTDDDVLDPAVLTSRIRSDGSREQRAPVDTGRLNSPRIVEVEGQSVDRFTDGVPNHAHWVSADFTSAAGIWAARNQAWKGLLTGETAPKPELEAVISDLQSVHITEDRVGFSLAPVPLGVWADTCESFAQTLGAKQASALRQSPTSDNRWVLDGPFSSRGVPGDAYVHEMSRGQAVVEAICQNCHGVDYDSKSPLASTILELSGGEVRVADLRNGLFGPMDAPGAYADAVFTFSEGNDGTSATDWAARYLLFMGMGGTAAKIPLEALVMVATSPFYEGVMRNANDIGSANMLATVPCDRLLQTRLSIEKRAGGGFTLVPDAKGSDFVVDTGHFQLWESVCGYEQQPIIRVMGVNEGFKLFTSGRLYYSRDRNGNSTYPEDALVGDQLGRVVAGIQPGNITPWCALDDERVRQWIATAAIPEQDVPFCPPELFASAFEDTQASNPSDYHLHRMTVQGAPGVLEDPAMKERWVRKGQFNAGLAAYLYMDRLSKGLIEPAPKFNSADCAR